MRLPLSGIRIADLSHIWAGPHCTQLLANMGAEVIKVEPSHGDMRRGFRGATRVGPFVGGVPGEKPWNRNVIFNLINRNKKAISLNLRSARGKEIFKKLVRISDIVVENYRPGALGRLGLDYEDLKNVKPDIIMVHMSGYGQTGPWRQHRAYGIAMEPMCGFFSLTGYLDDATPLRSGVDHLDPQCATHTAGAILAALLYRRKTGKGQCLDVSYLESGANFIGDALLEYNFNHHVRGFSGNRHSCRVPHGCYRCAGEDEWVVISVGSDEEWQAFCQALGNPPWSREERFAHAVNRLQNQDELDKLIEAWTSQRDKTGVMRLLQSKGVAAGAVLNLEEVFHNEHLKERGYFETIAHPEAGVCDQFGSRFKFSKTPLKVYSPAPCFGEHKDYVLGELLGLGEEEIKRLVKEKVVFEKPEILEGGQLEEG